MPQPSPSQFVRSLLRWYSKHKRDLPWRRTSDPYRIWVSEIMLQQTRVETVIPYYQRFLDRYPTIATLAKAPEQELLEAWSGLGYYRRARMLHAAAKTIVDRHDGRFPDSYDAIRALPGIGDYTAAAIASIAFELPHAVLDGNVMRLISRLDNDSRDITKGGTRRAFQLRANQFIRPTKPGERSLLNQALMELGATICLPKNPRCAACPWLRHCRAVAESAQQALPVKTAKKPTENKQLAVAIVQRGRSLLLRQRAPDEKIMPGFWELPTVEGVRLRAGCFESLGIEQLERLGEFRHAITFRSFQGTVYSAALIQRKPADFRWIGPARLEMLPLTTVTKKSLAAIDCQVYKG